jgi:uncharacterized protein YegP (UPF0339 family)
MVRFHPYKAKDGKWHFSISAANGNVIAVSEAIGSRDECESVVEKLYAEVQGIRKMDDQLMEGESVERMLIRERANEGEYHHRLVKQRLEKLKKIGLENLVSKLGKAYAREAPNQQSNHIDYAFLKSFWARQGMDDSIRLDKSKQGVELRSIVEQVEILANGRRTQELARAGEITSRERESAISLTMVNQAVKRFDSEQELMEELAKEIKDLARSGSLRPENAYWNVRSIIHEILDYAQTSWSVDRDRIENLIMRRWPQIFPELFETLSPDEKERLHSFFAKTTEELTAELVNYFEDKGNWAALFDRSPQGRRNSIIKRFWQEKYPGLEFIPVPHLIHWHIIRDVKDTLRLGELETRVYGLVLNDFLAWAKTLGKSSVSSAEEREFLKANGLLDTPVRFKTELLQDVNNSLRSS